MTRGCAHALLLAYYFHDDSEIGALRPLYLARHSEESGWLTTVVSGPVGPTGPADAGGSAVIPIAADSRLLDYKKRLGVGGHQIGGRAIGVRRPRTPLGVAASDLVNGLAGLHPDSLAWSRRAYRVASAVIHRTRPSVIVSTSKPETSHLVGAALARRHRIPWVADLRDLWSDNANYLHGSVRRAADDVLERLVLRRASGLTTVSEPLRETLMRRYEGIPAAAIPNGFDPVPLRPPPVADRKFTIVYTGRIYHGRQHLHLLLEAVARALREEVVRPDRLRLEFYGPHSEVTADLLSAYELAHVATQHGSLPRREILNIQARAQLLLHLRWEDPSNLGVYAGKLFEYLGARRPILSVGSFDDLASQLVRETGAGSAPAGPTALYRELRRCYQEFEETGQVRYRGDPGRISRYTYSAMAQRYFAFVEKALAAATHRVPSSLTFPPGTAMSDRR